MFIIQIFFILCICAFVFKGLIVLIGLELLIKVILFIAVLAFVIKALFKGWNCGICVADPTILIYIWSGSDDEHENNKKFFYNIINVNNAFNT